MAHIDELDRRINHIKLEISNSLLLSEIKELVLVLDSLYKQKLDFADDNILGKQPDCDDSAQPFGGLSLYRPINPNETSPIPLWILTSIYVAEAAYIYNTSDFSPVIDTIKWCCVLVNTWFFITLLVNLSSIFSPIPSKSVKKSPISLPVPKETPITTSRIIPKDNRKFTVPVSTVIVSKENRNNVLQSPVNNGNLEVGSNTIKSSDTESKGVIPEYVPESVPETVLEHPIEPSIITKKRSSSGTGIPINKNPAGNNPDSPVRKARPSSSSQNITVSTTTNPSKNLKVKSEVSPKTNTRGRSVERSVERSSQASILKPKTTSSPAAVAAVGLINKKKKEN